MAVVVRAPHVDNLIEAPLLELVAMVGNVGGEIGVEAVGTAQHIVLQIQLVYLLSGLALPDKLLLEQSGGVQP